MSVNMVTQPTLISRVLGHLMNKVRSFFRAETGTVTVESVIILPLLFFGVMATFSYFDAYRKQSLALKANYAIADYLSRIYKYDQSTIDGLDELFEYMSKTGESSWVRVTVVRCNNTAQRCNEFTPRRLGIKRDDSAVSLDNGITKHTRSTMREFLGPHIPVMYSGEELFVVETVAKYKPLFPGRWTGIYSRDFEHIVVTGSREYDGLCFESGTKACAPPPAL